MNAESLVQALKASVKGQSFKSRNYNEVFGH